MRLQESGEMYLETIYVLSQTKTDIRAVDVCEYMNYSKPSVSRAMSLLKEANYISVGTSGFITLTDSGKAIAVKIYERHTILSQCLTALGVDKETAAEDACRIEHVISDRSFDAIKSHIAGNKR